MVKATVIPASPEHIVAIAANVRQADIDELLASSGRTPAQALSDGLSVSGRAWTVLYDEKPVAMAGVAALSALCGVACPWMIATTAVEENPVPFLRISRKYVAQMRGWYRHLLNFVDARNSVAIRYLEWLGFTMAEPEPAGVAGLPFRRFEMRESHV